MKRRIFITGATGFVGRHLMRHLDGAETRIFGTAFPEAPRPLDLSCESDICSLDIRKREDIFQAVEKARPDWVFHLAAVSNVGHSWEKRTETLETNILGTMHVFEAVRAWAPEARILFISSSNVYAAPRGKRALQESDATHAVSPYAFTKISGELLSRFYAEVEGLEIVIPRAFPHTGPGQSPDFVCSDWARQIASIEKGLQESVIQVGNIQVERDFTDVRDVVSAYIGLIAQGEAGQVYNVALGKAVSLREVLDMLLSFSSERIRIAIDPCKLRKTDIPSLVGDSRKLRDATGWVPRLPLEQTLRDLLEDWRQQL